MPIEQSSFLCSDLCPCRQKVHERMNEWVSEWIANKSMMLRKHSMMKRRRSFPAHVHRVSTMVIVSVITIPTLCKSIIEREPSDHFSFSTCRVRIRASRSLCCSVTSLPPSLSALLLSLSPSPHPTQLHTRTTYARCRVQSTLLFFTSDFVSHPLFFLLHSSLDVKFEYPSQFAPWKVHWTCLDLISISRHLSSPFAIFFSCDRDD